MTQVSKSIPNFHELFFKLKVFLHNLFLNLIQVTKVDSASVYPDIELKILCKFEKLSEKYTHICMFKYFFFTNIHNHSVHWILVFVRFVDCRSILVSDVLKGPCTSMTKINRLLENYRTLMYYKADCIYFPLLETCGKRFSEMNCSSYGN